MNWQERLASLRPEVREAIKKQLEERIKPAQKETHECAV